VSLNVGRFGLDQGIFDRACDFRGEYGSCIHRAWDWFFPSLEHLVHLPSYIVVDKGICLHKGRIKLTTKEEGIWRANILDNGIEDVESREFLCRSCLTKCK